MTATAYYNEIDPFAAAWLRNLIDAGCIAPGVVDTRSVEEVTANDLKGFTQCHFFAGIGVWSYALRCAGWPDSRPVWTGSCPCQPFSQSGKRRGFNDPRHLWPTWRQLIKECAPYVIFGEQVASKDGLTWFDAVQLDLEEAEYAVAVVDLCAAGFGAPHIRQRLFWVADADNDSRERRLSGWQDSQREVVNGSSGCGGTDSRLAYADNEQRPLTQPARGHEDILRQWNKNSEALAGSGSDSNASPVNSFWRDADWLFCRDGKWRPVKPGIKPLVNGTPGRVGQLRAYGNAIVAPVAETFIRAYMEAVTP
ncbi:DNA cytosine methyltransferase [Salmonella enterica]|uniref:DNA (cytosine-5-)-methyltransferase n=2 Tax=Salmonella enterica TaxID=28901 RepID=A0A5V7U9T2_SALNE|nr:DNA cytosine methyltransferase [Salmonella enterica subsp. enterica serovar Newport]EAB3697909.1 DNA cytosine methyltransferase [Salmonella enterica]EDU0995509.1 DNA cytosine methyltransferase [Salmonella enterica subsp. enterica serovar Baildon]EEN4416663.1 DNA cytosine methyltransferase [Salmonella enterica subsp. enterica serovar Enteritidis]EAB3772300.1 DNA cytosine methyltransferase [Salmonella enterica]